MRAFPLALILIPLLSWGAAPNDAGPPTFPTADSAGNAISSNNSSLNVNTKTPIAANAPTSVSVGTSSTSILASNSARKGLIITNNSSSIVSIGIGAAAVLNSGITLLPGGVWTMDEFNFVTGAINGIASAAASSVAVQEFQ